MLVYLLAHLLADQQRPSSQSFSRLWKRVKSKNLLALLKIK